MQKKISWWPFEMFSYFSQIWHFVQIVSWEDNLLEMSNPILLEKKKIIINLVSGEFFLFVHPFHLFGGFS